MASNLSERQAAFVAEFLIDLNATQAAIRAGYSEKTAKSQAARLLTNPKVQDAVANGKSKRMERCQIDSDYVLNRLYEIDTMDVIDILNRDGSLKNVHDWPKVWRQTISGLDIQELASNSDDEESTIATMKKIKWPDKVKNLELLGKHVDVQAFNVNVNHSGDVINRIMPVPVCNSVDDWEKIAEQHQAEALQK